MENRPIQKIAAWSFGLAMCAVPVSIAVAESLLICSLALRLITRERTWLPRTFWFWLAWAALEIAAWLRSPEIRDGTGEIRHLLLIAALFLQVSILVRPSDRVAVWRGVILTATVSSLFLISTFVSRLLSYHGNLDPIIYLRNGGLVHHWMIYGTVEILVFAGLLQMWHFYAEDRWWLLPAFVINFLAILVSLTRMLWICCLLILALHFVWRRSRWIWAVPAIPVILFLAAPAVVRSRVIDSSHPDYYSNAERVQMMHVGWKMIREHPLTGVGPGRVEKLYTSYLSPGDPVPAYHGHLHNNLIQLAAEFGLPVAAAALMFVVVVFLDLRKRGQFALDRDELFLNRTAVLAFTGFVASGFFDYTYGHALGLILLGFAVLSGLLPSRGVRGRLPQSKRKSKERDTGGCESPSAQQSMLN